jgi:hypothetical protein
MGEGLGLGRRTLLAVTGDFARDCGWKLKPPLLLNEKDPRDGLAVPGPPSLYALNLLSGESCMEDGRLPLSGDRELGT